ncbi:Guanine nucleotide binding protein (G-protein) domain containing protein [Trichostrongylus colubriformis]|uniref:Guanine nucleotide binding protein (G-protein) domain containing protein n=1 Tax=Trichostrongylus colubriformis TaxID=6319 RepID=A0AAN8ID24_TRICO
MGSFVSQCCNQEEQFERNNRKIVRFFMIGTGGAGKTTVIRQLKCLCKERSKNYKVFDPEWNEIPVDKIFSNEEMSSFRKIIRNNILTAIYNLIQQTADWGHDCQPSKSVEAILSRVDSAAKEGKSIFDEDITSSLADDLIEVLQDSNQIADTLDKHHEMARKWRIEDGTLKFLSEKQIKRLFDDNLELTTTDIVHARHPTTDVQDFRFSINGTYIQIHDMGGQPTEMMKLPEFMQQWIAADREGYMNFILFVTSIADFNVQDEEEERQTAMERSIRILDRILSVDAIQNCGLLIFFNKQDIFNDIVTTLARTEQGRTEIIKQLSLTEGAKRKLADGSSPTKVVHRAIETKFDSVIQRRKKGAAVYIKDTQAVDPYIMADIFNVIENEIIADFIRNASFIM